MTVPTRRVYMPIVEDGRILGNLPADVSVLCLTCRHWTANLQCAAFPDVIPAEIVRGEHDHREPYPGDRGIRYELTPGFAPPPELS